jgi:hypothetical protein
MISEAIKHSLTFIFHSSFLSRIISMGQYVRHQIGLNRLCLESVAMYLNKTNTRPCSTSFPHPTDQNEVTSGEIARLFLGLRICFLCTKFIELTVNMAAVRLHLHVSFISKPSEWISIHTSAIVGSPLDIIGVF